MDIITPILQRHHSKEFDEGFIKQKLSRQLAGKTEDYQKEHLLSSLGTHGLNSNDTANGITLPKWTNKEKEILADAYDQLALLLPKSVKYKVGGLDNVAFPYRGNIHLDGKGKLFKEEINS